MIAGYLRLAMQGGSPQLQVGLKTQAISSK